MNPEESSIERLKRTLYSRNEDIIPKEKRTPVAPKEYDVPTDWGSKPNYDLPPEVIIKRNNAFFNKYFFGSVVFFLVSVGVAAFIFLGGLNTISSNNITMDIIAPTSVSSGEELSIGLSIKNGNRTTLEDATLFIDYPDGTESVLEENKPISHEEVALGVIENGQIKDHSLRVVLFGEKDTVKTFSFRIEYKVTGSNATFSKEKTYEVLIGSSPIILELDYPKEVNSGQNITIDVSVTSNSSVPIKDAIVKIEYPYGFTYKGSNIKPVRDDSVWSIGDLKNGDKKIISINGVLIGQNLEDRSFRISAGTKSGGVFDFDTPLVSNLITMGIRKSFFDLEVDSYNNGVANPGATNGTSISWQNTLPDKIVDSTIEVKLSGNALDRSRVTVADQGFYRSVEDKIVWDKNTTSNLGDMSPGDSGRVSFSVASISNLVQPKLIKNPYIDLKIVISGERVGRDGGKVSSTEDVTIKISSVANLTSKSLRSTGPFSNSGPIPPKADMETTYTISWTLTNTTSDLRGTSVRAVLPQGVSWKGETSPSSEKITFDPDTRVVTWDIGNVSAGSGFTSSAKQVYFKLGIVPSLNQVSTVPNLLLSSNLTSIDSHTGAELKTFASQTNTKFEDGMPAGGDIVAN
ncbi:MAG TPA: hypothetical protein PLZ99_01320 [Parcubacteria group bacterium]|nr:hypothetical protein [Parcubacteria group bacterium]